MFEVNIQFGVYSPYLVNCRKQLEEYSDLQQRCRDFFMEFVAQICFSPASPEQPNESFLKELLQIALNLGDPKYEELFPIAEEQCLETIPVMRSFLLQFTLEFRYLNPCSILFCILRIPVKLSMLPASSKNILVVLEASTSHCCYCTGLVM